MVGTDLKLSFIILNHFDLEIKSDIHVSEEDITAEDPQFRRLRKVEDPLLISYLDFNGNPEVFGNYKLPNRIKLKMSNKRIVSKNQESKRLSIMTLYSLRSYLLQKQAKIDKKAFAIILKDVSETSFIVLYWHD